MAAELSIGAVIGIAAGGVVLLVLIGSILFYRIYKSPNKRNSKQLVSDNFVHLRKESRKRTVLDISYNYKRESDEDELRRLSDRSKEASYQFDAVTAINTRDNTGRVSYDRPFTVLQQAVPDQDQVEKRQSLERSNITSRRLVAGYGLVVMRSYENLTQTNPPRGTEHAFLESGESQTRLIPENTEPLYAIPDRKRYTLRAEAPLPNKAPVAFDHLDPYALDVRRSRIMAQQSKNPRLVTSRSPREGYHRPEARFDHVIRSNDELHSRQRDSFRDSNAIDLGTYTTANRGNRANHAPQSNMARHVITNRDVPDRDSFQSGYGVDLGGNFDIAWNHVSNSGQRY